MKKICKNAIFSLVIISITGIINIQGVSAETQKERIDSLKLNISTTKNDSVKFKNFQDICFYYAWADPDSAIIYAQKELLLAKKLGSKKMEMQAFVHNGLVAMVLGDYSQSLDFYFTALHMSEIQQIKTILYSIYTGLSLTYRDQGDYEHAIYYAFKANTAVSGNNRKKVALGLIGSVYEKFGHLDSALVYINQAYIIDKTLLIKWPLLPNTMGNIYEKKGSYPLALQYYSQGIELAKDQNVIRDLVDMYNGMAKIYFKTEQIDSSIYYAKKIINIGKPSVYPLSAMEASNLLADLYKIKNQKDSTLKYLELTTSIKDSLFNREKLRQVQNISLTEKMRAQEVETARQTYRNQIRNNAFLGSTFTLIVIAIFLFVIYRRKQKAKQKIEAAFDQLKATQSQLIQSEKMASLGELTAGIAHEIQNPLNFVNNFSEVNTEMIDELQDELNKGEIEEAIAISNDIKQNEQKINHHGKRAESIVRGMLQHSRTSSGQKEPTDINKLADEYLRLSYHGLRAKDKSFNADFKMELDETLPKINVIPQDIGRVLLNLINNAFYAVDKKAKENTPQPPKGGVEESEIGYKPIVIVSTIPTKSPSGDLGVKITVKDNGSGIPENIKPKIFQPFFTTKPTGSGTGLGLSLSYDIIKVHGGVLKVESVENEGSEFIILLINS